MTTVMNFTTSGHFGSQNHRFFSMDGSQQSQELWFGEDQRQANHMLVAKPAPAPAPVPTAVASPVQAAKRPVLNISNIRVIPYTDSDWKRALADVKRDYTNKKYRSCIEKCKALLQSVKCPETVQPTYFIYMHFYAATSIEMQVRGFQTASPYRIKLLQDARQHYRLAAALAKAADERLARVKSLFPDPPPSSLGSPVESVMSFRSGTSTRMSSPTPSDDSTGSFTLRRPKKKVSFADELSYSDSEEPYVRPDSPTLGPSDLASGRSSPCFENLSASVVEDTSDMATPTPANITQFATRQEPQGLSPSFTRYCLVLSSIQRQISTHLNSIERDIDAALYPRPAVPLDEEMRALELQSRIERLRATGWQRRRFDAQRYEDFRERAMADMLQ